MNAFINPRYHWETSCCRGWATEFTAPCRVESQRPLAHTLTMSHSALSLIIFLPPGLHKRTNKQTTKQTHTYFHLHIDTHTCLLLKPHTHQVLRTSWACWCHAINVKWTHLKTPIANDKTSCCRGWTTMNKQTTNKETHTYFHLHTDTHTLTLTHTHFFFLNHTLTKSSELLGLVDSKQAKIAHFLEQRVCRENALLFPLVGESMAYENMVVWWAMRPVWKAD